MPGSNTNFQLQVFEPNGDRKISQKNKESQETLYFSITIELETGVHYYKYFLVESQPSWGLGEWPGDPNREVNITEPTTINNIWGTTANFAGGNGSFENPFLIATAHQLHEIRNYPIYHYKQIADIDLGVAPWNEGTGWVSIGNNYNPFMGSFNGNGFKISNLTINQPQIGYLGLFGFAVEAEFKDVFIENATIAGNNRVGILCGITIDSQIENCFTSGEISIQSNWSGGLTGVAVHTQFSNSYSIANIQATGYSIGGLTGTIEYNSTITNCYAVGNVSGSRYVGGLVGWADGNSQVIHCYSTGLVSGGMDTGGLIGAGYDLETINSYWNVETSGQSNSFGGTPENTAGLLLQNTYSNWNFNNIWDIDEGETYAFLQIQSEPAWFNYPPLILPPANFSAIPGNQEIALSWSGPSIGSPTAINIYRNGELFQTLGAEATTYLDQGLENYTYYSYFLTAQFGENESETTPVISTFPNTGFSDGDGSFENPFQVGSPEELFTVRLYNYTVFKQIADIDLGVSPWKDAEGWLPIGEINKRATVYYDGNGYKISNLTINRPETSYIGLFGAALETYLINIVLEDVNLTGYRYTGALVGHLSYSEIFDCQATGQVNGGMILGGLVGMATYYSYVINSYASVNVTQAEANPQQAGGLMGRLNQSDVFNCFSTGNVIGGSFSGALTGAATSGSYVINSYATGHVEGNNYTGGLIGSLRNSLVAYCYSVGEVSGNITGGLIGESIESDTYYSYWNTLTSLQNSSYGGTPKTTVEMTKQATFPNWDFYDYGTWSIAENTSYPYFQWQLEPWEHNFPASQTTIEEAMVEDIRIFPNPARSILWAEFINPNKRQVNIQLMNIQGQIVDQMAIEEPGSIKVSFNTANLPAGLYLLIIRSENLNVARKVVIRP